MIPGLSEEKIQYYADSYTIYQRGQDYYKNGAIIDLVQSGQQIQAEVDYAKTHLKKSKDALLIAQLLRKKVKQAYQAAAKSSQWKNLLTQLRQ